MFGNPALGIGLQSDATNPCRALLFAGSAEDAARLRTDLASDEGPIVPVIERRDGGYDATRLVAERTLTVNTTASGGNASLLSLEEGESA